MKLYRVVYQDDDMPCNKWAGTQADAKALQKELEAKVGKYNVEPYEPYEVPTSKDELLAFLNKKAVLIGEPT